MATLKQRLYKKNASGGYDTIHLETSASAVLMSNGTTVEAAVNGKAASNHTHTAAQVGALATNGTAAAATKLATARSVQVNLASTAAASFNGTANITPGVTGVLPIARGGTGTTSIIKLAGAIDNELYTSETEKRCVIGANKIGTIDTASWLKDHPDQVWFHAISLYMYWPDQGISFISVPTEPIYPINIQTGAGDYARLNFSGPSGSLMYLCGGTIKVEITKGTLLTLTAEALCAVKCGSTSITHLNLSGHDTCRITYKFSTVR